MKLTKKVPQHERASCMYGDATAASLGGIQLYQQWERNMSLETEKQLLPRTRPAECRSSTSPLLEPTAQPAVVTWHA